MSLEQAERIVLAATQYLLDPPSKDDSVVEHRSPEELRAAFADTVPLDLPAVIHARSAEALGRAAELVLEYSVKTAHPRFFNQNFAGPDPVAVAGDWLSSALNTTNATYEAAPVFTLMEDSLLRKLGTLAGYPANGRLAPGLFAPGGSTATLYALQLARQRRQPDITRMGANPDRLAIFVSAAGHYAAQKSAALLGIGMDGVIEVETENDGSMIVENLAKSIDAAGNRGLSPLAVIATSGTTVTSAFDPLGEIADICEVEDLWLHVDASYGGSALFSKREQFRLAGVERSDSFVWNLHKMMGITQQCTALLIRNPEQLESCFATGSDYLFQPDKLYGEIDSGDRHFQCARRVDALKLWFGWNAAGDEGFASRIDHAVSMADHLRNRIEDSEGEFMFVVRGDFTNVVFMWVPSELRSLDLASLSQGLRERLHELTPRIKGRMQAGGSGMIGFQPVGGMNCFRWLFMNPEVTTTDIDEVLTDLARHGELAWSTTAAQ